MTISNDEIQAVAQAITDAHAHEPGMDCGGRLELAKSVIAAFDAIAKHRNMVHLTAEASGPQTITSVEAVIVPLADAAAAAGSNIPIDLRIRPGATPADNVTALKDNRPKPKSKGKLPA